MVSKVSAMLLSGMLLWASLVGQASAALIETGDALAIEARQDRIDLIQSKLARDEVQDAMIKMGVDPLHAQERVASLSDHELMTLENELDSLPAGGGFFALVGVVFVVLIILELVGVTNIFTKA